MLSLSVQPYAYYPWHASCLFSLYSQSAFYTGYVIHTASLLISTCKGIICQKHRSIQVDIAKTTQTRHEVCGGGRRQARLNHGTNHELCENCMERLEKNIEQWIADRG